MTESEIRNLIVSTYLTEFSSQFSIAIDNIKFTPPNPPVKWVRISVKFNTGSQQTLGEKPNRKFIHSGLIFIQVFTPINTGTDENDSLATESKNLLDGEHIQDLWMYNGRIETQPSDDQWYQQNVVIEFKFEDTR